MTKHASDTVISVPRFTRQVDGDDVLIGNVKTGTFLAVPPEAVEILDCLAEGQSIQQASEFYRKKYGEELDIDDFLEIMKSKGFIIIGTKAKDSEQEFVPLEEHPSSIHYHFSNFPQPVARLLYGRFSISFWIFVIVLATIALAKDRYLIPRPSDFVFPQYRVLSFLTFLVLALGSIFLHELSHVIAARALGVNARLGISNRLWFLVAEADITGLWAVPKRQRYLPLLAGILTDAASAAMLILLLFAYDTHWIYLPAFVSRICKALVLSYWLRIVWQFYVFVRTDMYFVITNYFDCRSLLRDTEDFLRNLISPIVRFIQPVDQSHIPESEQRVIKIYSVCWVAGRILALYVLVAVTVPVVYGYLHDLFHALHLGIATNMDDVVDSLILSIFVIGTLSSGLFLWIRGMLRRERT
jgi:putative peptide zinc metalloprotease protein